ncbi:MAG: hypothetical protein HXY40_09080 [Chloroflexi bacterium]|nr:hypothetical protein [Chloroflexota bacterium]
MPKRLVLLYALFLLFSLTLPAGAQDTANSTLQLNVVAGFDGRYRSDHWLPVLIRARNDGEPVSGRLVVRPETSGAILDNTFSTPIDLPSGARKTALLYIVPRSLGQQIRVELIDNAGVVLTSETARVQGMQPLDMLYVVVSAAATGSVDMTGVTLSGYSAFQANWTQENLPGQSAALEAVDVLMFSNVDTSTLTPEQRQAIDDWVACGGHLIVTGGANWQATAAAFGALLPLTPENSRTIGGLGALAGWTLNDRGGDPNPTLEQVAAELRTSTLVASGTLRPEARTLAAADDGTPLLLRRLYGNGVVDYLTADPGAQPLRSWAGLSGLWFSLISTREPLPSWGHGYTNWEGAESATLVIPGYNLLPDTFALCGFLALYIALIGPLNYFILNRVNRREYAWLSIPALIVVFSAFAWVAGFNLRGSDVTLNRLTLIQAWPDVENARVDALVGLLAPRRATYSLIVEDNSMLRLIPRQLVSSPFSSGQVGPDIQQSGTFRAADYPVDASFIAGFNATGSMPRPDIGGQAALTYSETEAQSVRGAVSNNSEWTLLEPLILARGGLYRLDEALGPGDTVAFSFGLGYGQDVPIIPAPVRVDTTPRTGFYYGASYNYNFNNTEQTVVEILGEALYRDTSPYFYGGLNNRSDPQWQANTRRRAFLSAFIADYFASTARADRVYLLGWVEAAPTPLRVEGAAWREQDVALLVVELQVEALPASGSVTITPDRFTWVTRQRQNVNAAGPYTLTLYSDGEISFRYTPLPDAVLERVDQLYIYLQSDQISMGVNIELWNWQESRWETVEIDSSPFSIPNPARYLGPQNAVEIRLRRALADLSVNIGSLWIAQRGSY